MINIIKKSFSIFLLVVIIFNFSSINCANAATDSSIIPVMSFGKASWYVYEGGLFAASPDYIKGTELRVTNTNSPEKSIVVTVNDYGPNRILHPDRVIDLDKVAFAALAPVEAGIIDVKVELVLKDEFKAQPVITSNLSVTSTEDLSRRTVVATITTNYNDGELWQDNKTGGVYYVNNSTKQPLTDRIFLKTIFKGEKIISKTPATLANLKTIFPVILPNGYLIKTATSSAVYLVYNNQKRAFLNGNIFEQLGYFWNDIIIVPDKIINQYSEGITVTANLANAQTVEEIPKEVVKEVVPEIIITAKSAVILNATNGEVIYSKNASEQLPLASLTKMVALKVFLDTKPNLNKIVTYKVQDENYNYEYASKSELARLTVSDGETMTIRDLLYSSLLGSANNAVESLVRVSSLSRQAFIDRMNKYVKDIGTTQTKFIEPTGLSPKNVSSAMDYALITKAVLTDGNLEKVSMTKNYTFTTINTKKTHYLKNSNNLLFSSSLKVTGGKTGYLDESLYCLMTRVKDSNGDDVIVVTLGAPTRALSFEETLKLINYGLTF